MARHLTKSDIAMVKPSEEIIVEHLFEASVKALRHRYLGPSAADNSRHFVAFTTVSRACVILSPAQLCE